MLHALFLGSEWVNGDLWHKVYTSSGCFTYVAQFLHRKKLSFFIPDLKTHAFLTQIIYFYVKFRRHFFVGLPPANKKWQTGFTFFLFLFALAFVMLFFCTHLFSLHHLNCWQFS